MKTLKSTLFLFFFISFIVIGKTQAQSPSFPAYQRVGVSEYIALFIDNPSGAGKLYSSGNNRAILGTGGTGNMAMPNLCKSSSGALPLFVKCYGGLHDAAAIDVNGNVWHIGDSTSGLAGITGNFDPLYTTKITVDSAGNPFTGISMLCQFWTNNASIGWYAVKGTDSTLWMWGLDAGQGFRANGTISGRQSKPVQITIPGNRKVLQIVSGYEAIALCSDGSVWTWGAGGCNDYAAPLGYGCTTNSWLSPHQINIVNAKWVAGGTGYNYAICGHDSVMAWGAKIRLGIGTTDGNPYSTPQYITPLMGLPHGVTKIVTNSNSTHAILSDSTLWGWGNSAQGEVGNGSMLDRNRPVYPLNWGWDYTTNLEIISPVQLVPTRHDFINIYGAMPYTYYSYAEAANGQEYFWGRNKGAISGNGHIESDSTAGQMASHYDQSWNDPIAVPVDIFRLRKSICIPAAPCAVNGNYPYCNGYIPPANLQPTVNAGSNQSITSSTTTLTGIASPGTGRHIASYIWSQTGGPSTAYFNTFNDSVVSISRLSSGVYTFCLLATDDLNSQNTSCVTVTVNAGSNAAPVANAGSNQTIQLPANTGTLNGSASYDPDGTITTYAWIKLSGPSAYTIVSPAAASTTVTGLTQGIYVFQLTVTDNQGATNNATVQLTVNAGNQSPVANAGINQIISLPISVGVLDGSASYDPDGTITNYSWTKVSGPSAYSIVLPLGAYTTVIGLIQGTYVFQLTVTDNNGAINTSNVQISVNAGNQAPVANAGSNQTIILPTSTITLSGSGSDPDGKIVSYAWTQISGTTATITSPSSASTTVTGLTTAGTRVFRLTVTDNAGATGTSDITVVSNNSSNPPNSSKPIPGHIEGESYDNMSGVGIYPATDINGGNCVGSIDNGDWMDYNVSVVSTTTYTANFRVATPNSGAKFQIRNGSTIISTITIPNTGGWQNWVTVTINIPLTAGNQTLRIYSIASAWNLNWMDFLGPANANQPPVARAGADQVITLPVNSVSLDGTGSTDDHTIIAYQWTKLTGAGGSITTPTSPTTTFTGLTAGIYTIELKVTDDSSAIGRDTVQVTVNAAAPPPGLQLIPGHIEGESYNVMSGVGMYPTSDAGGGQCVGSIDNGDWMDYNVSVSTTGTYTVNFRVASPNAGAQFRLMKGTTILQTIPVTNTGDWQNWATVTANVSLSAGTQTLRIYSMGSGWNLNWADFNLAGSSSQHTEIPEGNDNLPGQLATAMRIFPNPVTNQFTIELKNDYIGPVKVQVLDQNGALVKQVQFTKNKGADQVVISANSLLSGMYIVRVQTPGWSESVKLIKQ